MVLVFPQRFWWSTSLNSQISENSFLSWGKYHQLFCVKIDVWYWRPKLRLVEVSEYETIHITEAICWIVPFLCPCANTDMIELAGRKPGFKTFLSKRKVVLLAISYQKSKLGLKRVFYSLSRCIVLHAWHKSPKESLSFQLRSLAEIVNSACWMAHDNCSFNSWVITAWK